MNDRTNQPTAAESAQITLQMLRVLQTDVSELVTKAREVTEESVMPEGCYPQAMSLYTQILGLLWKVHSMVEEMTPEIETAVGIAAQDERDSAGVTTH